MTARIIAAVGIAMLVFAALVVVAFAQPVNAAALCGPPGEIAKTLDKQFGEHKGAWATTIGGALIEVFESKSGSWTLVITQPNGLACLMLAGEGGWHDRPVAAPRNKGI